MKAENMKYVIIGNSTAAVGAVEGIRQADKKGEITIISNEPHHTYSRPLISYLLLGKVTEETMKYRPDDFYTKNNCTLLHATVTKIDAAAKQIKTEDGGNIPYDKLLVATGSSPFVPPFEGLDTVKAEDKFTFMSLDDARALDKALAPDKNVLIIGAGLIGLKCAEGIMSRVGQITVVDLAPTILSSILEPEAAAPVQTHLESAGISFKLGDSVKSFDGNTAVLGSGEKLSFDILVLAVGVRPNTALLNGIAEIDRGIVINAKSETTAPDIYAAGDCTQTLDISSGQNKIMALLPNAYIQGECAGVNMAGGEKVFDKAIPMNAIGFIGGAPACGGAARSGGITHGSSAHGGAYKLHVITAGTYTGDTYTESETENDTGSGIDAKNNSNSNTKTKHQGSSYKRLYYKDNKLNGYILVGNVDKAGIYTSLIREQTPLDSIDFALICEKPGLMAFTKQDRAAKLGGTA